MQTVTLNLIGEGDMLLHSDRGANPINAGTIAHKVLTSKRKKTDEDHMAIAKSEFMMGFYEGPGLLIPTMNIKSAIVEGAKMNKLGSAFNRTLMILEETVPVVHSGPQDKEQLWANPAYVDCRSVKVGQARLMRYRPKLRDWRLSITIHFDPKMVEVAQIIDAASNAGRYIGLGDYRPAKGGPFGRFTVEVAL